MVEDDTPNIFLTNSKVLETLNSFNYYTNPTVSYSKNCWSMVVSSFSDNTTAAAGDLSVFPPSNHENLVPTHFNPDPVDPPLPPSDSAPPSPPRPWPGPIVPRWWALSVQILRSRVANVWSCLGHNRGRGNGREVWQCRSVGIAAAAVLGWWFWVRLRQRLRRRREENVGHLLRIIKEKDERIMQLLSQIAQMNEVLLARHKSLSTKS